MPYTQSANCVYHKNYRAAHPEKHRAANARWRAAHPLAARNRARVRKYSITETEWDARFIAQGSCCAVCKKLEPESKKGWHTDHNHVTGRVRGILCHWCNTALHKRQTPAILRGLANYLEKHQ
jgi:hypothetical protein